MGIMENLGEAEVLEVRSLGAWEVAVFEGAALSRLRMAEGYFRRYRDGKLRVTLPRLRWLDGDD